MFCVCDWLTCSFSIQLKGSVIQYTRPSDLKRELNEHFRSRHPTIDPSITLSKIRKVKTDLLAISEELDLEISTVALAYAYFEKLILKGSRKGKESNSISTEANTSYVTKENRKMIACKSFSTNDEARMIMFRVYVLKTLLFA
jgi:hypothetical protein